MNFYIICLMATSFNIISIYPKGYSYVAQFNGYTFIFERENRYAKNIAIEMNKIIDLGFEVATTNMSIIDYENIVYVDYLYKDTPTGWIEIYYGVGDNEWDIQIDEYCSVRKNDKCDTFYAQQSPKIINHFGIFQYLLDNYPFLPNVKFPPQPEINLDDFEIEDNPLG